ncbi:MAG: hypothetical protein R3E97_02390 [Candidatus Eisenbacteria bacterium]
MTASVSSGSSATLENDDGVRLYVPPNTVPRLGDGSDGTLAFSIEPADVGGNTPSGSQMITEPIQFGPEGLNFAQPVQISFPAPDDTTQTYMLGRLDRNTDQWSLVPTVLDPLNPGRVCAHVNHLSVWSLFGVDLDYRSAGRIHFINTSSLRWVSVCVESYELAYPEWVGSNFDPSSVGTSLSAAGHMPGVTSDAYAIVPQGTWTFQAMRTEVVDPFGVAEPDGWITLGTFVVDQPGGPGQDVDISPDSWQEVNMDPPWAPCQGAPDVPVGTGTIQITLSWDPIVDLDLHVIDPSGEEIYFGNRESDSGGQLDRDTICQSQRDPENVFWSGTAPRGTYQVRVHFYGNCSSEIGSAAFRVRTLVDGSVRTFDRTVSLGETVAVTSFTR